MHPTRTEVWSAAAIEAAADADRLRVAADLAALGALSAEAQRLKAPITSLRGTPTAR